MTHSQYFSLLNHYKTDQKLFNKQPISHNSSHNIPLYVNFEHVTCSCIHYSEYCSSQSHVLINHKFQIAKTIISYHIYLKHKVKRNVKYVIIMVVHTYKKRSNDTNGIQTIQRVYFELHFHTSYFTIVNTIWKLYKRFLILIHLK